jgi:hypothetical protein
MSEWKPIESAPKSGRFLAAIKHGPNYMVVEVTRIGSGIHHVMEDSCVGWRPDSKHGPAYWMPLPEPPQ